MNLTHGIRIIALAAALGTYFLQPAQEAAAGEVQLLASDAVEFEGSDPDFSADGRLLAVGRVHFNGHTVDGRAIEGSGVLSLPEQANGDPAVTGILNDVLGRLNDSADGTSQAYTGWALVSLDPIDVVEDRFEAGGTLRLQAEMLEPAGDLLNIQVIDVIVAESQLEPDGSFSGRAEVSFSGVGSRDGVAVTVDGTAEFAFQGDLADGNDWFMPTGDGFIGESADGVDWLLPTAALGVNGGVEYQDGDDYWFMSAGEFGFVGEASDGNDWFMPSGEWRILNATLADAATGGALHFETLTDKVGAGRIVAAVDASGRVTLAGALGQVTLKH